MNLIELLVLTGNYYTSMIFIAAIILFLLKDKESALFAFITFVFFFVGITYYPFLIEWDSNKLYRYPIWILHDTLWMGLIAYLGLKDKINWRQSVLGQLFCIPLLAVNFFRALDMQFIQMYISTTAYRIVYPLCEVAIVLLCWLPIFVYLKNKFFVKSQPA